MQVECPYCGKQSNLKQVKPGRFKPKCSKCNRRFRLTIPDGDAAAPKVEPMPDAADIDQTTVAEPSGTSTPPSEEQGTVAGSQDEAARTAGVDQTIAAAPPQPAAAQNNVDDSDEAATHSDEYNEDAGSTAVMQSAPSTQANQADQTEAAAGPATPRPAPSGLLHPGQNIGGYRVEKELGSGAMGAVYLANQISLDRLVGMKVIQPRFAADPVFIARFTREAYAAAQIAHHNVVQIIDLGCERDIHYFTMEYVRGQTIDELIRDRGKLDTEAAVGFILQAARGLEHAHSLGMVHRDIKPANLMLSDTGAVKVADLGLVKMLRAESGETVAKERTTGEATSVSDSQSRLAEVAGDVTDPNLSMGTPLFMAPEQGESAADVDHRADIYSLGCTLYVMLTGQPPFSGASALEVITKHKSEPVPRPDIVVKRIPTKLSDIVMRMVAKRPDERYASLGEVITDLEELLGVKSGEPYSPDETDADELESAVSAFNQSKFAKLRAMIVPGCVLGAWLIGLLCLLFSFGLAIGFAAMGASTLLSYFAIGGLRDRTYLFDKVRQYLLQARITDWLMWGGGVLLALLIFFVLGIFGTVAALGLLGVGVGAALHFVLDKMVQRERSESLQQIEALCRRLRLKGVEEDSLQQFVAKYSGERWEEMFEAVFGYEAKLAARQHLANTELGRRAPKYRGWRDVIIRRIDERLNQTKETQRREHLQQVEEANLRAQGVGQDEAREQALRVADALLDEAEDMRSLATRPSQAATVADPAVLRAEKRARQKAMLADARSGKYMTKRQRAKKLVAGPLGLLLGGKARFVMGCALVAGCLLWIQQNGIFSKDQIQDAASAALERDLSTATESLSTANTSATKPLSLPLIGWIFDSFNPGVAGLLLIVSSLFRGWKMSIFAIPAAAAATLGPHFGAPSLGPLSAYTTSLAVAIGLAVLGLLFGRTPEE